jgi:hypothetical protein
VLVLALVQVLVQELEPGQIQWCIQMKQANRSICHCYSIEDRLGKIGEPIGHLNRCNRFHSH